MQDHWTEQKKCFTDGGNNSGAVYYNDLKYWNFLTEVARCTLTSNLLHEKENYKLTQMEAEIIRTTIDLYNGDPAKGVCGVCTAGGTESVLLSILAHREYYCKKKGISRPNLVLGQNAHPAFDKACFYFGVEKRKVPLTGSLELDLHQMRKQIDGNTIMLVGSCPDYGLGNFDNIPALAEMATQY
mmetsp:Transcript_46369/g.34065  ORF Transcript_46369/g.34065 Transcript_46369/m.34065 type:complete len:185 (+) Transcript_46369:374-928(+)